MAAIVDCQSCSRKLRIPEELLGQRVKCPTCGYTFDAAVSAPEPAAAPAAPPPREAPAPTPPPSAPAPPPRPTSAGGFGFVQVSEEKADPAPARRNDGEPPPRPSAPGRPAVNGADGKVPCPHCGERLDKGATRCRFCGASLARRDDDEDDDDRSYDSGRYEVRKRRDLEPHRATTVLVLGILSLIPLGFTVALGLAAWVMGQKDLRKMGRNEMDAEGRGSTTAGWICGIIGTVLNVLLVTCCGGWLGLVIWGANNAANQPPPPRYYGSPTTRRWSQAVPRPQDYLPPARPAAPAPVTLPGPGR